MTLVISSLSVISAFPKTGLMALLAALIIDSCTPLKWAARGELKYNLIPLLALDYCILVLSKACIKSLNSCSAPIKFVPLSDTTSIGNPRQLTIL